MFFRRCTQLHNNVKSTYLVPGTTQDRQYHPIPVPNFIIMLKTHPSSVVSAPDITPDELYNSVRWSQTVRQENNCKKSGVVACRSSTPRHSAHPAPSLTLRPREIQALSRIDRGDSTSNKKPTYRVRAHNNTNKPDNKIEYQVESKWIHETKISLYVSCTLGE